jgi:hypothetical protein
MQQIGFPTAQGRESEDRRPACMCTAQVTHKPPNPPLNHTNETGEPRFIGVEGEPPVSRRRPAPRAQYSIRAIVNQRP